MKRWNRAVSLLLTVAMVASFMVFPAKADFTDIYLSYVYKDGDAEEVLTSDYSITGDSDYDTDDYSLVVSVSGVPTSSANSSIGAYDLLFGYDNSKIMVTGIAQGKIESQKYAGSFDKNPTYNSSTAWAGFANTSGFGILNSKDKMVLKDSGELFTIYVAVLDGVTLSYADVTSSLTLVPSAKAGGKDEVLTAHITNVAKEDFTIVQTPAVTVDTTGVTVYEGWDAAAVKNALSGKVSYIDNAGAPTTLSSDNDTEWAKVDVAFPSGTTVLGSASTDITVTYNGVAGAFTVAPSANPITSLMKTADPTKALSAYKYGETLDLTGLTVTPTRQDGKTYAALDASAYSAYIINSDTAFDTTATAYSDAVLTNSSDNGKYVWIRANDSNAAVCLGQLTVAKVQLTAPTLDSTKAPTFSGSPITATAVEGYVSGYDSDTMTVTGNTETNAGTHTMTFALKDSNESQWSDSTTEDKTLVWSIASKAVDPIVEYANQIQSYTGSMLAPTVTVKDGDQTIPDTEYTVSYKQGETAATPADVGKYDVVITDNDGGNYSFTEITNANGFEITAASQSALTITGVSDKTYGDDPFEVTVSGGSGTGSYSLTTTSDAVSITGGTDGKFTVTILSAADSVTLTAGRAADSNHATAEEQTASFTIARKTITPVIVLSKTELNYTGSPQTPTVTVYTDSTKSTQLALTTDYTLKWTKGSEEVTSITDVGSYTATVTGVTSGSNYSFTQPVTATFTMKKSAQNAAVELSSIASSLTYGTPVTGVTVSGGSGTGAYSLVLDKTTGATENDYVTITADGTSFTITPKKATPDGTPVTNVTVYGKRAGDNNCDDAYSEGATFTIAKKSVTATIDTVDDKTYNGTAAGSGTLKLDDVKTGDAVTAIGTFTWTAATAGTTTISVSGIALDGADKNNYTLSNSTITAAKAGKSIAPKQVTLTWAPDPQSPYTGNPQTYTGATVVGAENNETLGVTYSETNTVTRTNAGSYTAEVIALSGDTASNYEFASTAAKTQAWTITPKAVTNPTIEFSVEKANYNDGADVTPGVTVKDGTTKIDESEYTLTWTGIGVTGNKLTLAGTYTLTVTDAKTGTDTGNYTISDKVASFTVDKTTQTTALNITGAENKTYGDADFTVTVGGGNEGTYGLASDNTSVLTVAPKSGTTDTWTVTVVAAGSAKLTATRTDAPNYADATPLETSITVAPKPVTVAAGTIAVTKVFNKTTDAPDETGITGALSSDDILAADANSVTIGWTGGSYVDVNAGTNKTFTFTGLSLSGDKSGNYVIASEQQTNGLQITTAVITPALIAKPTVTAGQTLTYNKEAQTIQLTGFDSKTMNKNGDTATDAGNHTVTVSLKDPTNSAWADSTTADVELAWSIARASVAVPTAVEMHYTGSVLTAQWNADAVTAIEGLTITGNTGTDRGEYTATLTPGGNYQWADNTTAAKQINWNIVAMPVTIAWTVDGTAATGGSATQVFKNSDFTVAYTITGDENADVSGAFELVSTGDFTADTTNTNAGTYKFKLVEKESKSNYSFNTGANEFTLTINPLAVTVKWFAGDTSTEYAATMPFVDDDYALPTPKAYGTDNQEIGSTIVLFTRSALTKDNETATTVNSVGSYAATASLGTDLDASNYTVSGATLNFAVTKADVTFTWKVDDAAINAAGYAFDFANGHTVSFDVACPGVTDSAVLNKLKANFVIGSLTMGGATAATMTGSTDTAKKVNAVGSYTATIGAADGKSLANFNITEANMTATFKINPMELDVLWTVSKGSETATPDATGAYPFIEDASGYTVTAVAVEKGTSNPVSAVSLTVKQGNETAAASATIKNVAEYAFTVGDLTTNVTGDSAANYSLPTDMGATTIEIVPATVTVDWKIGKTAATSATYTGSAQTVSAVVKNGTTDVSGKFNVTVPTGASYDTSLTNAGEYGFTVAAKDSADTANYTLPTNATQTITIAKATRTIHVSTETTLTSHGEAVNATLTISADKDASAENTVTWSAFPDGMVDVTKGTYTANSGTDSTIVFTLTPVTNATGQTTVTFTLPATDNYEAATVTTSQKNTVTVDIKAGYNVTVGTITNGTVTPSVNVAKPGDTVTVTVAPATGYKLDTLTYTMGEGSPTNIEKNGETYSFTMGSADTVINATFAQETYAITKHSDSSSAATIKVGSSTVGTDEINKEYDESVELTVTTDSGAVSSVSLYKEDGTTLVKALTADATTGKYSFKMPNYPVQVKAVTADAHTVSKNTAGDDNATITLSSGVDTLFAAKDATVTFKVAPTDTSHTISSVTLSDTNLTLTTVATDSDGSAEYRFVMGSSNVAITAKQVAKTTIQTAVEETGANAIAAKTDTTVEKTEAEISVPVTKQAEDEIMAAAVNTKVEDSAASVLTDAMTSVGAANKIESDTEAKQQQATAIQALAQAGLIHIANDGTITESGNADAVNAVNIVNKVYMEAEVKDYDESKANTADASITMDVKPMTQQVATIEDVSGTYTLTEENSAPIAPATEMTISDPTQPIPMRMGITDTMAAAAQTYSASMIFIRHVHNAKTYEYRAMLQGSVGKWFISFVNYYGFSEFTLSLKPSSVASAQVSGERRYYTTFKDAVDAAVGTGAANVTVYLHKAPVDAGDKPTTIAAPLQITLDTSEKDVGYTPDFTDLYGRFAVNAAAMVKASTSENINNGIFKFVSNYTVEIAGASSVTVGGNTTLTATVKDSTSATYVPSGSDTLVWTSSNTGVATVDSDGKVTGVAAGSATITATFKKNNADPAFEGTKTITVTTSGSSGGGAAPATNVKAASGVKNGSVKFSSTNAKAGDKVTVTATPNQGYKVASVTVKDSKGNDVAVTENADGTFSFTMPSGAVTVTPVFEKADKSLSRFIDVDENAFYAKAVEWAVSNGITDGVSDTEFAPNDGCTRAQAVTFLYRAAGAPEAAVSASFQDVAADSYYAKAVAWAVANGITNGMSDTEFAPDAICTRAQIVTFLSRYEKAAATSASKFADVSADAYYAGAVGWAVANGITDGVSDTEFAPDAVCTRAHIVTFLYRDFVK